MVESNVFSELDQWLEGMEKAHAQAVENHKKAAGIVARLKERWAADDKGSQQILLNVPYKSQWGPGANKRPGDCGPACLAMLAGFWNNENVSVDEAADVAGQATSHPGHHYTGHRQLRDGAKALGFKLTTFSPYVDRPLNVDELKQQVLLNGAPSIVLLHYGLIRDGMISWKKTLPELILNQDTNFVRGHWALFVGWNDLGAIIHDSDFWGSRILDGKNRLIPWHVFESALSTKVPGSTTVGYQGLVSSP